MKKLFIIANWKSNKTVEEAENWFKIFQDAFHPQADNKQVIICPPNLLVPLIKEIQTTPLSFPRRRESSSEDESNHINSNQSMKFAIGLQDFSPFEKGAYTGEEPAALAKEFAEYAIIGHSERRTYFHETEESLAQKVSTSEKFEITPIFCIQNENTPIPKNVTLVAYEPPTAIGSGHPDTPESADKVAQTVKTTHSNVQYVLYGGSVSPENVHTFTQTAHIDGVLIGGASLDPAKFIDIIQNA